MPLGPSSLFLISEEEPRVYLPSVGLSGEVKSDDVGEKRGMYQSRLGQEADGGHKLDNLEF